MLGPRYIWHPEQGLLAWILNLPGQGPFSCGGYNVGLWLGTVSNRLTCGAEQCPQDGVFSVRRPLGGGGPRM